MRVNIGYIDANSTRNGLYSFNILSSVFLICTCKLLQINLVTNNNENKAVSKHIVNGLTLLIRASWSWPL